MESNQSKLAIGRRVVHEKYLFLLGVVVSLGVLFSKNVEASETKVTTIDNETVALEKVEDLETISSILEEYGYSTEEVGSVYKYTVEDPVPVFNRTRAYRMDVLSAAYRKHKIATGAALGTIIISAIRL